MYTSLQLYTQQSPALRQPQLEKKSLKPGLSCIQPQHKKSKHSAPADVVAGQMATSICTQASTLTSTILTSVSASVINTVAAARSSSEAVEAAAVAAAEEAINANATHSVRN